MGPSEKTHSSLQLFASPVIEMRSKLVEGILIDQYFPFYVQFFSIDLKEQEVKGFKVPINCLLIDRSTIEFLKQNTQDYFNGKMLQTIQNLFNMSPVFPMLIV